MKILDQFRLLCDCLLRYVFKTKDRICNNINNLFTCLKNKIENNWTWEGAFYQSEWVKNNSNWVILVFSP